MSMSICVCTAYTEDYSIGRICSYINGKYASKHGYEYVSEVASYEDTLQAIYPRTHCTWAKVSLIRKLLLRPEYEYIVWIDADAVVVDDSIRLEDIIETGGRKNLILAENMSSGFLVNAGVMLVRNTPWSHSLWRDVWQHDKHHATLFYEQSSLMHQLRARRQGLMQITPFHSFSGGPLNKEFEHVFVYCHMDLNTNRGWVFPKKSKKPSSLTHDDDDSGDRVYSVHEGEAEEVCARFIYHAAGVRNKMSAILGVLLARGVEVPGEVASGAGEFRLVRSSTGGVAKERRRRRSDSE